MNHLLISNGFKKIKLRTTGISLSIIKKSKGQTKQSHVSKTSSDEVLRGKIEEKKSLKIAKSMANFFLNLLSIGITLKAYYEKK